jgi:hypothetical protein
MPPCAIFLTEARKVIVASEFLGNLGSSEHAFGLFWGITSWGLFALGARPEVRSDRRSAVPSTQIRSQPSEADACAGLIPTSARPW